MSVWLLVSSITYSARLTFSSVALDAWTQLSNFFDEDDRYYPLMKFTEDCKIKECMHMMMIHYLFCVYVCLKKHRLHCDSLFSRLRSYGKISQQNKVHGRGGEGEEEEEK